MSHHIGKWHNGYYEYAMTPPGRGFDSSLGFLTGGEDHWTSEICMPCPSTGTGTDNTVAGCRKVVDLTYGWAANHTIAPATELNGSYTGHSFSDRSVQLIRDHDAEKPLFLFGGAGPFSVQWGKKSTLFVCLVATMPWTCIGGTRVIQVHKVKKTAAPLFYIYCFRCTRP